MEIYPKPPSYYYLSTRGNPVVRFTRIFKSIYKCAQEKKKKTVNLVFEKLLQTRPHDKVQSNPIDKLDRKKATICVNASCLMTFVARL